MYLRQKGLSPSCTDRWLSTPLHWACYSAAENAVCYLAAWVKNLNMKDSEGYTPLHLTVWSALVNGNLRPLKMLLLHGASRKSVVFVARRPGVEQRRNTANRFGWTRCPSPSCHHQGRSVEGDCTRLMNDSVGGAGDAAGQLPGEDPAKETVAIPSQHSALRSAVLHRERCGYLRLPPYTGKQGGDVDAVDFVRGGAGVLHPRVAARPWLRVQATESQLRGTSHAAHPR